MLYTIVPIEYIFAVEEIEDDQSEKQKDEDIEITKEGVSLLVQSLAPGQYKVTRIISTNPNDYLRPEWQPGVIMSS
jgi:hypothetical protein